MLSKRYSSATLLRPSLIFCNKQFLGFLSSLTIYIEFLSKNLLLIVNGSRSGCRTVLLAFGKLRQKCCERKAILGYTVRTRLAKTTQQDTNTEILIIGQHGGFGAFLLLLCFFVLFFCFALAVCFFKGSQSGSGSAYL